MSLVRHLCLENRGGCLSIPNQLFAPSSSDICCSPGAFSTPGRIERKRAHQTLRLVAIIGMWGAGKDGKCGQNECAYEEGREGGE